jgi:hypothetical protein
LPRRPRSFAAGGTAVRDDRFPIVAVAVPGAIVLVLLIWLVARGGGGDEDEAEDAPQEPTVQQPAQPPAQPVQPNRTAPASDTPAVRDQPAPPDPRVAAADLERSLRSRRYWSTMEVRGANLDVRSGSCDDAGMRQMIDGAAATLRGAGLTRLRCVAQSGAVVFERDL